VDQAEPFDERMRELRAGFIAMLPSRLETMRAALRELDRAALQSEAHRLAGTGVSYGLPELTVWGRDVERKCKDGLELPALAVDLDALAALIARLAPLDAVG
jgi:HPt (histidine-containing phosphotransfer) domain-containing protein